MYRLILHLRFTLVLILVVLGFSGHNDPMLGFSSEQATRQLALEASFDTKLNKENLRTWMKQMTAAPQHVGSPQSRANAEFMVRLFQSWGYEAQTEVYQVLFSDSDHARIGALVANALQSKITGTRDSGRCEQFDS